VVHPPDPHSTEENQSHCFCDIPRLLPTNNLKEPTRPKAEKLGAQSVKSVTCYSKNLGAQGAVFNWAPQATGLLLGKRVIISLNAVDRN